MENRSNYQPVRGHQRYIAQERTLVDIPLDSKTLRYNIIDICEGGLSFLYLGKKNKTSEIPPINLYHAYELIVGNLPVRDVSDYRLHNDLILIRRRSLCFGSLSIEQQNKLSDFIERLTNGSKSDIVKTVVRNRTSVTCI